MTRPVTMASLPTDRARPSAEPHEPDWYNGRLVDRCRVASADPRPPGRAATLVPLTIRTICVRCESGNVTDMSPAHVQGRNGPEVANRP